MNPEYWKKKWDASDIGFHRSEVTAELMKHIPLKKPGKIFVPLCGKTLDMKWLAEQGHQIVGVELEEKAAQEFFSENKISFTKIARENFVVYESPSMSIWCGDFFKFPKSELKNISMIYDRAALVALPDDMRKRYVTNIKSILKSAKAEMFLISFEYPPGITSGPPFSIDEPQVRSYFEDAFKVTRLESVQDFGFQKARKFKDVDAVYSVTYLIGGLV